MKERKRSVRNKWLAVKLAAALLFLSAAVLAVRQRTGTSYKLDVNAVWGEYSQSDGLSLSELQEQADQSGFRLLINGRPEMESGGECPLMLGNPSDNSHNARVTLLLDHDQSLLYESPVIKPGDRIPYVELQRKLPGGNYAATAIFHILDEESDEEVGAVAAGIEIIVREEKVHFYDKKQGIHNREELCIVKMVYTERRKNTV